MMVYGQKQEVIENGAFLSPYAIPGVKREWLPKRASDIKPKDWIDAICRYLNIPFETVNSKTRKDEIVYARQLICYLLCMRTRLSLKSIMHILGNAITHHTTVMHGRDYISGQISINNDHVINDLEKIIETAKYYSV